MRRSVGTGRARLGAACAVLSSLLFTLPVRAAGAPPANSSGAGRPESADLQVFLMTFGPGGQVWERFGHNALWIHDATAGTDEAYNYGLFDFHQQNFLLRFVRGQMWYWMAAFPAPSYVEQYRRDNRSVWVQELALSDRQKAQLQTFLRWNAEPSHRFYHYDYYRDNCSTRVRDALDRILGGALREQSAGLPSGTTYRFHTQRLTANDPLIYTGLLLALGQGVDQPISRWQEMFLPLKLREHVRHVMIRDETGRSVPLVRFERTIFASTAPAPPAAPPGWLVWYLLLGCSIGLASLGLGGRAREKPSARFGFLTVSVGWSLIAGIAGILLAGLWGLTDHVMAYRNENLLQMDPVALLLVPALFLAVRRPGRARPASLLAVVCCGVSAAGLVLKMLPGFDQVNGPIIALALPAYLGIATAVLRLRERQSEKPPPSLAASTSSAGATRRA